ncbi:methyltransferase family protein [Rhodopseudomonas thermotolerans]|uniref:Methyltransferase family protein n=2 Tax=Rhodopseudomonas TaxID=1073 RepID=A0A336JKV3_9BRAD|nr:MULTISPECIES: class I SAM-dependent methyltransferase [Rhodopseudomonas]RED37838.1 methyltransferase family protein [Rhodopseudomonas pentothenatexigens]REG04572.1 methyltransferase family protein [Rhodopseudomonas thermotolerans]SSW90338.1 methyltransferase family protein [Rhodopseudomonas pentothenatexigens]
MAPQYTPRLTQDVSGPLDGPRVGKHRFVALADEVFAFCYGKAVVWSEIAFGRLGLRSDFVGYETLIAYIDEHDLWSLDGDILEIGAFMGGGTAKLAIASRKHQKGVLVIDVFDPHFDSTQNTRGEPMSWIYSTILGSRDIRARFDQETAGLDNISVRSEASMGVELSADQRFLFSFIDGNHSSDNVLSDLAFSWARTVPGGVVALHDYGGDLPSVTRAVDHFYKIREAEIDRVNTLPRRTLIFLHKGREDG